MFKNVRVKVLRDTNKRQMPWVNSSLTADFQFNPQAADTRKEDVSRQELKRLQDLLNRRDQQKAELEAKVKAMQRQRVAEVPPAKPAAKPVVEPQVQRCVWCFPASTE